MTPDQFEVLQKFLTVICLMIFFHAIITISKS